MNFVAVVIVFAIFPGHLAFAWLKLYSSFIYLVAVTRLASKRVPSGLSLVPCIALN